MAGPQRESVEEIVFELSPSPMHPKETRSSKDVMREMNDSSFVHIAEPKGKAAEKSWDDGTTVNTTIDLLQEEWEKSIDFEQNDEMSNFSSSSN